MAEDHEVQKSIERFIETFITERHFILVENPFIHKERWFPAVKRQVREADTRIADSKSEKRLHVCVDAVSGQLIAWILHRDNAQYTICINSESAREIAFQTIRRYLPEGLLTRIENAEPSVKLVESVIGKPSFVILWQCGEEGTVSVQVEPNGGQAISFANLCPSENV